MAFNPSLAFCPLLYYFLLLLLNAHFSTTIPRLFSQLWDLNVSSDFHHGLVAAKFNQPLGENAESRGPASRSARQSQDYFSNLNADSHLGITGSGLKTLIPLISATSVLIVVIQTFRQLIF